MLRIFLLAFGLALSSADAATPVIDARAPRELTQDEMAEIVDFVVGNAVFALYHQAGHMMIERFSLDASGGERAADRFATVTLLNPRSGAGDQTLVDAIDSWKLTSHDTVSAGEAGPFPVDPHSLNGERADAIVCDMVGADPDGFSDIADASGLSATARADCAVVYGRDVAAWTASAGAHRLAPGANPLVLPVVYEAPTDDQMGEATILQDNRVLEEVAERLGQTYALASPPTIRAMSCGEATSRFDATANELVLCYELSAYHGELILRDIERRN